MSFTIYNWLVSYNFTKVSCIYFKGNLSFFVVTGPFWWKLEDLKDNEQELLIIFLSCGGWCGFFEVGMELS